MRTRPLRALRGASAAAIAVLFAAVSHTIAGGTAPSLVLLLSIAALAWPLTTWLVRRRLRPAGLAIAVLLAQSALHIAFAVTSGIGSAPVGLHRITALHQHSEIITGTAGTVAQVILPSPPMFTAHAIAAVASFVLLFAGERMLRAIAAWALRLLDRAAVPAGPVVSLRGASFSDEMAPLARIVRGAVRRRGPPLLWSDASVA